MKHFFLFLSLLWGLLAVGQNAYYPFNGNANDYSGSGLNGSITLATGVTSVVDRFGTANSAYKFDGTGYITTTCKQTAVTQYTVSAWVKMNNGEYGTIVSNTGGISYLSSGSTTASNVGVCFGVDDDGKLRFGVVGQNKFRGVKSLKTVNDGQWHHVVAVLDCKVNQSFASESSCVGFFKIYIDGVLDLGTDSGGGAVTAPFTGQGNTAIGEMNGVIGVSNSKAKGIIDEVRILNRSLTSAEISQQYAESNATLADKLLLYCPFNGDAKDYSGNGFHGTVPLSNVTAVPDRLGRTNSAYYFGGGTDKASIIKTTATQTKVTDYTVSAWVKMNTGEFGSIVTNWGNESAKTSGIVLRVKTNGHVEYGVNSAAYLCAVENSTDIRDNKWHCITGVFSCPSGTLVDVNKFRIYIDGAPMSVIGSVSPGPNTNPAGFLNYSPISGDICTQIGETQDIYNPFTNTTKGTIDEVKIYARSFTDAEISQQYADATSALTNSTLLYYPLNGNTRDFSGNGLDGTLMAGNDVSATKPVLTTDRFGNANSAYLFHGLDVKDRIERASSPILDFKKTDSLTFSCWLNLNSFFGHDGSTARTSSGNQVLFAKNQKVGENSFMWWGGTNRRFTFHFGTDNTINLNDTMYNSILKGNWNQVTLCVTPTTKKIYVNGKLYFSAVGTYDLSILNGSAITFGRYTSDWWYSLDGSLDDIRLYKRELTAAEIATMAGDRTNTLKLKNTTATIPNTFPTTNTFTVEMWVKPNVLPTGHQGFFGVFGDYSVPTLFVNGNSLHYNLNGGIGGTYQPNVFAAGQWTHIAWVNENNIAKIYKNGVLITTRSNVASPKLTASNIELGSSNISGDWRFDGQLDEVRIWSTARSAAQIQANLNKELSVGTQQPGLTASYSFNGTMNSTASAVGSLNTASYVYSADALRTPALRACTDVKATCFTANWCPLPGALGYQLQYASDAAFTNPTTITAAATDSSKIIDKLTAGVYYVRVQAQISATTTTYGNWSDVLTVSTPFAAPGKALSLTGDVRYVQIPTLASLGTNFTVEGWVYLNAAQNAWARFFELGNGNNADNIIFCLSGNGDNDFPKVVINSAATTSTITQAYTTEKLPLKTWTHVAMTANASGLVTVYFNGRQVLSTTMKTSSAVSRSINYLGKSSANDVEQANAIFDEFRIYNTALTQDKIIENAHKHLTPKDEPNLVLYYDFDTVNAVVHDLSKSKADGILFNTPAFANSQALLTPFTVKATNNQADNSFTATWDAIQNPSFELQYALDTAFTIGLSKTFTAKQNSDTIALPTEWSKVFYRVRYKNGNDSSVWVSNSVKLAQTPPALALSLNNTAATKNFAVDKYLTVPSNTLFNGNFTVDAWVNPGSLQADVRVFDFGTGSGNNSVILADKYVKFTDAAGKDAAVLAIPSLPLSQWTHVALTFDATKKVAAVYYNGVLVANATLAAGPTSISRNSNFIGASNTGNPSSDMLIDEFRIYTEVLVLDTLVARSHRHLKGTETNLALYYDFDNASTTSVPDVSVSKLNATLVNTPALANSKALLTPFVRAATDISQNIFTANWDAVPSAFVYQWQYTTASATSFDGVPVNNQTTNSYTFGDLPEGSSYQYRVRTISNRDTSEWSVRKITLHVPAPGNALLLDNTSATKDLSKDKYVAVPSGKWLNGSFTVDAWVYRRSAKANDRFFDFGNGAGADNVLFSLAGGYVMFISTIDSKSVNLLTITGLPSIPLKQWNHIALTLDSISSTAKVYYNGALVGTGILSSKRPAVTRSSNYIGASNFGDASSDMLIDEFRISNKALSATEIAARMHRHLDAKAETDLQLYYDFDFIEGDGQTVTDLSTNKQNGLLMNGPSTAASKALLTPFTISASNVTTTGFTASCEKMEVATSFEFQYVAQGKTDSLIINSSTNTGIISSLQAATTYSYRVRSNTAAITGEWSKSASVTLPVVAPGNALQSNTTDLASGTLKTALANLFTVECWVAPSAASFDGNYRGILGSKDAPRTVPTMWIYGTTLRLEGYTGATQKYFDIPNFFNKSEADAWVHIAWVQNGTSSSFYRNGVLVGTSPAFTESLTGTDFVLNYIGTNSLSGKLDEVRFWNKALSVQEIKAGLHTHLVGNETALAAYYDFDYTNGKIITDLTVNKQNAAMTNTATYSVSKALLTPFIRAIDSVKTNDIISNLTVKWDAIPNATYKWQVSDAANFSNILKDDAKALNDTTASITIDGKQYAYYYRIVATVDGKTSDTTRGSFADPSLKIPNMAYNGAAISVATTNDITLSGSDAVTMSAWVKFSAQNNTGYIYTQYGTSTNMSGKQFYVENGFLKVSYDSYNNGGWTWLSCPIALSPNVWNHVAYTQSGGMITMYINGTPYVPLALGASQKDAMANTNSANVGGGFAIDNFQIWKAALSQADITNYAHAEVIGSEPNLALAYNFNQIAGETITDVAATTIKTDATLGNNATAWIPSKAQLTPFVYAASKISDSSFVAKWSKDAAAKTYTLRYASTADFTAAVVKTKLTDTTLQINNLQSGIKYYLSIRSMFDADSSEWSTPLVVSTTSLTDSLIAYYPFNGSANNMIGNVAAVANTASITTDRFGKTNSAYDFTNGHINAGDVNDLDTSFTIAAWINEKSANTASVGVVSKFNDINGGFEGYNLSVNENGDAGTVNMTTASAFAYDVNATKYSPSTWNFVCARFTNGKVQLFLNDTLIFTKAVAATSISKNTLADFVIGKFSPSGRTNTFQGSIDDIRIYRRPLSDGELSNLYHEGGWPYTGIAISNSSFKEQQNIGTTVGVLSPKLSAPDTSTTFSYRLVSGVGSTDNDKFTIANDGKTLLSNYIFDITQQTTASVRIQGTNTRTNVSFSYPVSIAITDASATDKYDFENLTAGKEINGQDSWIASSSVTVKNLALQSGNALSSAGPVDASNQLSTLFKTVKIDDLSAQYVLSYDVSSSDWGTFVGLMYDSQNKGISYSKEYETCNVFQFKTSTRADAPGLFFKPDYSSVPLLVSQYAGWYRVEITISNLNTANATITARAKSLASAGTSWMPILNETSFAIDSTASDKKNPLNWNTFYAHIEGSEASIDNISFSKRVKNANRVTTTDGLVLWLKMDNNLLDASGNKHDGVQAVGTSAPAYDRFGNANSAYDMKGISTFHVEGFGGYVPTEEISVSAWAKNNTTDNGSSLFMLLGDNTSIRMNAHLCANVVWDFGNINSPVNARVSSTGTLHRTTGVWNHYVFTSSQKSNTMNIYMNNVLVATKPITTSITQDAKRWLDIATNAYNGVIDDFRVYNRELSATEVASLYYEGGWPVQKITVPSNVMLQPGISTMLSVVATPSDAKAAPLVYASNNPAIATIDNTGKITGVKAGITTITVTTANSSVSATCVVTVQSDIVKLTKLALVDTALNLTVLNDVPTQLKYTAAPSNAFLTGLRWMSSNSAVVSVSDKGVISALAPGVAHIYLSDTLSKLKDTCVIRVLPSRKPVLVAGVLDTFKLRAVTKVNGVWEAITPLKITLPVFFNDDDSLAYSYTLVDTVNQALSGDTLLVTQKTAGVSAAKPIVLQITATDRNAQSITKLITVKMMSEPDMAPKFTGPAVADTMYQFRRTSVLDLSKYIVDDFTPFNRLTYTNPELTHALVTANIVNGKLSVTVDPSVQLPVGKLFSDTVRFAVSDGTQSSSIKVAYSFKSAYDLSPVFTTQPSIVSENSDTVVVINLSQISKDDLSPNSKLRWSVVRPVNINAQLTDSILTLSSNNSSWTGSENIIVYVYDEGDNLGTGTISYSQNGFTPGPKISFSLNSWNVTSKQYEPMTSIITKGTKVYAKNTTPTGVTVKAYRWLIGKDTVAKTASYEQVFDKTGTYSITLIADNNSGRTTVTQKDAISVVGVEIAKGKSTICKGDTIVLKCSNSKLNCAWYSKGSEEKYGVEYLATPSQTTTYYLRMTLGSTEVIDSVEIMVITPIANVAKDTTVCAGVACTITPSGFAKLFWNGAAVSAASYTTSKADTIAVRAFVDADETCRATLDTIKVTRLALPVIGLPAKESVCKGSSKKLVALGGNTINDYHWNKLTVLSDTLIAKEEGTYIVTVKAANGCVTSDTTVVAMAELPEVVVSSNKLVSCKNAVIQLSTKTKEAGLTYKWNVPVTADTTAVLAADGYNDFYVSVTNANGCTGWDSVRVNANTKVSVTITPNKEVTACAGKSVEFAATGAESYSWSNGLSTAGISLTAMAGTSNIQKVYVTATKEGCTGKDSVTLTALALPTVAIAAAPNDTLCKGDSLMLTASGAVSYVWDGTISNGKNFAIDQSGTYRVTATDKNACSTESTINVEVNSLTTLKAIASDSTICLGDTIRLYGRGAKSYTWDTKLADSAVVKPLEAKSIVYTVTGTDTNSCKATATVEVAVNVLPLILITKPDSVCKGATTVLTAMGTAKTTYIWSDAVVNGVSFIPSESKVYKVTATTDKGCVDTSSMKVNVKTGSTASALTLTTRVATLCKGDSLLLNGEGNFATIVWNETIADNSWVTPLKDSIFTVKATDAQKCVVTDAVKVTVNNRPEVTAHVSAPVSCQGRSVKLWATANETVTYKWNKAPTADSSMVLSTLGANDFIVTATNDKQCSDSSKVSVTVNNAVSLDLKAMKDTICAGDSVLLDAKGAFKVTWADGLQNGKYIKPTQTAKFIATVTDNVACESKDSIVIVVHALPIVTANRDTTVCSGRSVVLTAKGAVSYEWNNGAVNGVAKTITDNTSFSVTGTDANGCKNKASVAVTALNAYKEELGVVTTDSSKSEKVIVAWNRSKGKRTERYIVYRQNGETWDSIGGRAFADTALVMDKNVSLLTQAYRYKLVTVDSTCHNRATSEQHRTMHIFTSKAGTKNWINVGWNAYEGLALTEYIVYRVLNGTYTQIAKEAKGEAEYHVTDTMPQNGASYRVFYKLPNEVLPLVLKSDTGPFSQSMSNMSEASLVSVSEIVDNGVSIYPNPTSDVINITATDAEGAQVNLVSTSGAVLAKAVIAGGKAHISVVGLANGIYMMQLQTNNGVVTERVEVK